MQGVPEPGLILIKTFEGCHLSAYADPLSGGVPYTIGWGSTRRKDGSPFQLGDTLTQAEADDLLIWQVKQTFLPTLARIPRWAELNPQQAGAVLSFAYNLGADFYGASGFETISRTLREGQWADIEYALTLYRNPRTNVEEGLLRRRLSEAQVFLEGTSGLSLSAPGIAYLGSRDRTYQQNNLLSDQAQDYLAALKGGGRSSSAATPSSAPSPSEPESQAPPRLLHLTDPNLSGEDVRAIQQGLARAGIAVVVDGFFGTGTQLAVERYQKINGLTVDGVVGEVT
jgi:GH24 family phage-related lysozyme (muramidase)